MVEGWSTAVVGLLSAVLGYGAHVLQSRIPTKDNQDSIGDARRSEALEHFRWAAELAVAEHGKQRRLGADQMQVLVADPYLLPEDLRRVRAAIESALVSGLVPWEDDDGGSEDQGP